MQVYVGKWAGRRWFFPTVFYQNSLRHENPGWHIPEQARFLQRQLLPFYPHGGMSGVPSSSYMLGRERFTLGFEAAVIVVK